MHRASLRTVFNKEEPNPRFHRTGKFREKNPLLQIYTFHINSLMKLRKTLRSFIGQIEQYRLRKIRYSTEKRGSCNQGSIVPPWQNYDITPEYENKKKELKDSVRLEICANEPMLIHWIWRPFLSPGIGQDAGLFFNLSRLPEAPIPHMYQKNETTTVSHAKRQIVAWVSRSKKQQTSISSRINQANAKANPALLFHTPLPPPAKKDSGREVYC